MEDNLLVILATCFLGGSLLLYLLLGGADFGAGIIELFASEENLKKHQKTVNKAMGPVWEVNHIWLIIALVITFNAFPKAFAQISITFHIPLTFLLIGIILRGCAFAFRNYDAYKDKTQTLYSLTFAAASLLSSMSIGLIIGGLINGEIVQKPDSFYQGFIAPWFNIFSFLMGGFVCSCFLYIATVYIVGETNKQKAKSEFIEKVGYVFILMVGMGTFVFSVGIYKNNPLFFKLLSNPMSLSLIGGGFLLYIPIRLFLVRKVQLLPRLLVGVQMSFICLAWAIIQFPYIIPVSLNSDFQGLNLFEAAAGQNTLANLLIALTVGAILIMPSIFFLFRKLKLI